MRASFSGSANAVASSSTTIGASLRIARARATRCTSPPDRYAPPAPRCVSRPCGSFATMSSHCAARSAASTCSRVASGLAARTFSPSVPLNSRLVWKTNAILSISSCGSASRTSTPPTSTRPAVASQKRGIRLAHVDLPTPDGPTERKGRAGGDFETHVVERIGFGAFVSERHMLEAHVAAFDRTRVRGDLKRLRLQDRAHATKGIARHLRRFAHEHELRHGRGDDPPRRWRRRRNRQRSSRNPLRPAPK